MVPFTNYDFDHSGIQRLVQACPQNFISALVIKAAKLGTKRSGWPTEFDDREFEQEDRRRRSRHRRVDRQHVMRKALVNRADYKPSWALNEAGRTLINA